MPTRIFNITGIQAIGENEYPAVVDGQLVVKEAQEIRAYNLQGSLLSVVNTNRIDLSAMPKGTILLQVYYKKRLKASLQNPTLISNNSYLHSHRMPAKA